MFGLLPTKISKKNLGIGIPGELEVGMTILPRLLSAALLTTLAVAQVGDPRELTNPTGYGWYYGVTSATLNTAIGNGYRLTDVEVDSVSPLRFNACLVADSGVYDATSWWYYGLTAGQVSSYLSTNNARLTDLECYDDGNGNTRFACIMVSNAGVNAKTFWWYYGQTSAQVASLLATNGARPVDIDTYEIGNTTRYSVVMIANSGADQRNYTTLYNQSFATISAAVSNTGRRCYDLEHNPDGTWSAILIDDVGSPYSSWWVGIDAARVSYLLGQYGMRPIDIESYQVNGERRFAVLMLNNSNALTTGVGQQMRATTDGQVGCYLKRINGSEYAGLNEGTIFEPASCMKTLHHVHAMRQVRLGNVSLNTMLPVNQNYAPVGSSCPGDTGFVLESLTTVLRDMMQNSDNTRTQAVRAYFGEPNINATANALGMSRTELRHRIGCGTEATANPNDITLYDLGLLHTQVANGYLGTWRDEFYDHMSNSLSWGGLSTVVNEEAATLNLSAAAITSFKAQMYVASKGGSYGLADGSYRSGFGYVRVPFLNSNVLAEREFAVGAFVARTTNGTNGSAAVNLAIAEMLRPQLRAALQTWDVTAVAVPYGGNCGGMNQTVAGLPRLGGNVDYHMTGGEPWRLDVLATGFSNTQYQGLNLPLALQPFGSLPGCFALCSAEATDTGVADGGGAETVSMSFPNSYGLLGIEYFTQFYSLGTSVKSSRALRNVIGW